MTRVEDTEPATCLVAATIKTQAPDGSPLTLAPGAELDVASWPPRALWAQFQMHRLLPLTRAAWRLVLPSAPVFLAPK